MQPFLRQQQSWGSTTWKIYGIKRLPVPETYYPHQCLRWFQAGLGLKKAGINISASCASSTIAIAQGSSLIASGQADAVLVCCADIVTEFTFSGFSSLKIVSPVPCRPFDKDRSGLTLGDGAAALLLMSDERARKEGRKCMATIKGWGIANDAFHITSPAQDGSGLASAIERALARGGLQHEHDFSHKRSWHGDYIQ